MKVLCITYNLGNISSSGASTIAVIKQLASQGIDIKVFYGRIGHIGEIGEGIELFKVNPRPISPARLYEFVGNIISKDITYLFWQMRTVAAIKKILNDWKPDVIYARGSPFVSMKIGYKISRFFNIPLFLHFADPIPAPKIWKSNYFYRSKMINEATKVLMHSKLNSFVTKEMMDYQGKVTGISLEQKSFISPNSMPNYREIPLELNKVIFGYIGTFYGARKPDKLLMAASNLIKKNIQFEIWLIGNNHFEILELIKDEKVKSVIKFFPYSTHLDEYLNQISVLLEVDADIKENVFISNKIMEYLSLNRLIIAIFNESSSLAKMLNHNYRTIIKSNFEVSNIENSLLTAIRILQEKDELEFLKDREKLYQCYSIKSVGQQIIYKMQNIN